MSINRPATKSGPLFDLIGAHILENESPDDVTLARLRREAAAVLNTRERAVGHILLSGVSALEWDLEEAKRQVDLAVKADPSVHTFLNALVTFDVLGRPDVSVPYAAELARIAPSDAHAINEASGIFVSVGRVEEAAAIQAACLEANSELKFEIDAQDLASRLERAGISEDWLSEELQIARTVLVDAHFRPRQFEYQDDDDPDGGPFLSFCLRFYGSLQDEFRLDDELALKLSASERWNPSRLSVQLHYLVPEEHARDPR